MALQNLINVAVTSADVVMLGKVGEVSLSASSLAGQIQFIMTLIFFGLTSGAAVLTAQYWGKGDTKSIEKVLGIALRFSIVIGIIFFCGAFFFPSQIMSLFSPELPVIEQGAIYLKTVAPSYLFVSITIIYLNIIRSIERVLVSTIVYLISLIVNVVINAILIFGLFGFPQLGIQGAAIGTVIARAVELIIVIFYSRKLNHIINFKPSIIFIKDKRLFSDFLHYSIPVTLNELMWAGGTSMSALIIGHLGSPAVAANSVAQVTRQFATVVAFGLANATAIIIGKAIGEGKLDVAKLYAKRLVRLTLIAGFCGAIIILIIRPIAIANLVLSVEAQNYLSVMMFVMAYFTIGQAYNTTMIVGVFRSGGDTKFGLYLDVLTMWGGCILLGALCAFWLKWPVLAVYVVLRSDEIVKLPFTTYHYKKMKWLKSVTRE
ncbi:MAG: MATE family efflux transporter [Oscillospiraceae bacterium]